jgi:hypothetical protein
MVLPGHLAGGYLVSRAVLALAPAATAFSPAQTAALLVIGTLFGDSPDIDLIFYYFNQRSAHPDNDEIGHRHNITHTPIFWLGVSLAVVAAGWIAGSLFTEFAGWMILAGSWTHLLLDSIEVGIRWLWPFSEKIFLLRKTAEPEVPGTKGTVAYYWKLITSKSYLRSLTVYAEIAITLAALWVAFHG